jgi:hypothetical protein
MCLENTKGMRVRVLKAGKNYIESKVVLGKKDGWGKMLLPPAFCLLPSASSGVDS